MTKVSSAASGGVFAGTSVRAESLDHLENTKGPIMNNRFHRK